MRAFLVVSTFFIIIWATDDVFSCFVLFPSRYMEHSGNRVIRGALSAEFCLQQCMEAEEFYGFVCKTVMWKKDTKDCIMSKWTTSQRASFVKIDNNMSIDLYESICGKQSKDLAEYSTGERQEARTTVGPNIQKPVEVKLIPKKVTLLPFQDFRRARARVHNAKPLIGHLNGPGPRRSGKRPNNRRNIRIRGAQPIINAAPTVNPPVQTELQDDTQFSAQLDGTPWFKIVKNRAAIRPGPVTRHWLPSTIPTAPPTFVTPIPPTAIHVFPTLATSTNPSVKLPARPQPTLISTAQRTDAVTQPSREDEELPKPTKRLPCFRRVKNYELAEFEERRKLNTTLQTCLTDCTGFTSFYCASVNFEPATGLCIYNGGNLHLANVKLRPSNRFDYFENTCSPGESDQEVTEAPKPANTSVIQCFNKTEKVALISLDSIVIRHLQSLEMCLSQCLESKIPCTALNWMQHSKGCMIFHGKIDKSQLSLSPHATFYENMKCKGKQRRLKHKTGDDYYDQSDFS